MKVGEILDGNAEGLKIGAALGPGTGASEGVLVTRALGTMDGAVVCSTVGVLESGLSDGMRVGSVVGPEEESADGVEEGLSVGTYTGAVDGLAVDNTVGFAVMGA